MHDQYNMQDPTHFNNSLVELSIIDREIIVFVLKSKNLLFVSEEKGFR